MQLARLLPWLEYGRQPNAMPIIGCDDISKCTSEYSCICEWQPDRGNPYPESYEPRTLILPSTAVETSVHNATAVVRLGSRLLPIAKRS